MSERYQYVLPGYEEEIAKWREGSKRRFLAPFFTNLNEDVYALTGNLPPVLAAALVARQSRAETRDARELLWQEFVQAPELGVEAIRQLIESGIDADKFLASEKARKMVRRIIDGFGDDSVREQASAYVMFQNVSILATTFGVTHPLLTRVEASTRYINWGEKENGRYRYKELDFGEDEKAGQVYEATMENCFGTYGELWEPVWQYVVASNPKEIGVSDEAYASAIRGRVCDNLRGLLPLAAMTNFGLHGDFRSLSELIMNLRAGESEEMREMGDRMYAELAKVNPEFVAVAQSVHGEAWTGHKKRQAEYLAGNPLLVNLSREKNLKPGVEVKFSTRKFLYAVARAFITSQVPDVDKGDLHLVAERMAKKGEMEKILGDIGQMRTNRRHELPEFLRSVILKLKFRQISFGSLKDLFRHRRILWRSRPDFSGQNGCHIPEDIAAMGGEVSSKYVETQEVAAAAVKWMRERGNEVASRQMLTHGMLTSFTVDCDLVEGYWISELRSIASGFSEYRWFAQQLWKQMLARVPALGRLGTFTNLNDYPLGRIREAVRADLRGRE